MSVNAQLLLFNFTPKIMQGQVFEMSNVWHCIHFPLGLFAGGYYGSWRPYWGKKGLAGEQSAPLLPRER
jgi:hypothetical protein